MAAQLQKGPGKNYITYRDDQDEVRIQIASTKNADGSLAYDVFLKDVKVDGRGQPFPLMLREKIRKALKDLPNPLDGKLNIY